MLYVEPDFYKNFVCRAGDCRHSCCKGWEIDVDADTAEYYASLGGDIGDKLRACVASEPEPHFVLTEEERCPFLRDDGLCELILTLGEDSLCDICTEHPRFYNSFPEREERGLGLCCEEAVRLLLDGSGALKLVQSGTEDETPELIRLRGDILSALSDASLPLIKRMERACALCGTKLLSFDAAHWRDHFLSLERMDEDWTEALYTVSAELPPTSEEYARIAQYLVYRHFASCEDEECAAEILQFCFLSVRLLASAEGELPELLRLFSSEIEYSDENIECICEEIRRSRGKHFTSDS